MPKYVLKEKRLSKTKTVIIFRRNHIDTRRFKQTDDTWVYEESFVHFGVKCEFKLTIHNENLYSMFEINTKSMKIKGPRHDLGIFTRLPKQKLPIKAHGIVGCAEYYLCCTGKKLAYDNGTGIKNTRKKHLVCDIHSGSRTPIAVPNSVSWSAAHPFQGGGFSPK